MVVIIYSRATLITRQSASSEQIAEQLRTYRKVDTVCAECTSTVVSISAFIDIKALLQRVLARHWSLTTRLSVGFVSPSVVLDLENRSIGHTLVQRITSHFKVQSPNSGPDCSPVVGFAHAPYLPPWSPSQCSQRGRRSSGSRAEGSGTWRPASTESRSTARRRTKTKTVVSAWDRTCLGNSPNGSSCWKRKAKSQQPKIGTKIIRLVRTIVVSNAARASGMLCSRRPV